MLDMLKRHAIQVLRQAGHSLPEVAKLAGVSVRSVQRVEGEGAVSSIDNEAERIRRRIRNSQRIIAIFGPIYRPSRSFSSSPATPRPANAVAVLRKNEKKLREIALPQLESRLFSGVREVPGACAGTMFYFPGLSISWAE